MKRSRPVTFCLLALLLSVPLLFVRADSGDGLRADTFTLTGALTADEPLVELPLTIRRSETSATFTINPTGDDLVLIVELVSPPTRRAPDGTVIASGTSDFDYRFASYGDYTLRVSAEDAATGEFEIVVRTVEEVIEANLVAIIDDETPFHTIPIEVAQTGTDIEIDLRETTNEGLDTMLYLVEDQNNIIIASNNDRDRINGDKSSYLYFPQAARGSYRIIATRYGDADGRTSGEFRLFYNLIPPAAQPSRVRNYGIRDGDLLNSGFPIAPQFEPREQTTWTIFAYYGGDNNLEGALINDLNEFELAGSDRNVRIVALLDRSPGHDTSNDDWYGARLFEIGPPPHADDIPHPDDPERPAVATLLTPSITDLGVVNSADGELFAQFLVWGIRNYPSDNYAISIGSHGAGWYGVVTDDTHSDIISLPEMQQALNLALAQTDLDKFAFLINDACFMSSIEYFDAISPYFDYALASPEIVVNPGHDMTLFTDLLREQVIQPDFSDISTALIDQYIDVDILARPGTDVFFLTSALTDLNGFDPVVEAVEAFATIINRRNPVLVANLLGSARSNTYTYQHFMRSNNSKTANSMVDLADLMRRITENRNADEEIVEAAQEVIRTLNNVRLYARGGERVEGRVGYYNIYFPERSTNFDTGYFDQSPLSEWGRMLRNYYNVVTPAPWQGDSVFHTPIAPTINIINRYPFDAANLRTPAIVEMEINGRNITSGIAVFDRVKDDGVIVRYAEERLFWREVMPDGRVELVNRWESGYQSANITWDMTLPQVTDGQQAHFEMLFVDDQTTSLEARYCPPASACESEDDWEPVVITFNREEGFTQRVISLSQTTNGAGIIEIPADSQVETFRNVVNEDGQIRPEAGNLYIWPEDGLRWSWQPAPDGEYQVGYELTAFGGTTGFATADITVRGNAALPPELRTYNRPGTGFYHPYPESWEAPLPEIEDLVFFGDSGLIDSTISPDGNLRTNVYVYFHFDGEKSIEEILDWVQADAGMQIVGDISDTAVDGEAAQMFDMRITDPDGETFIGRAFAVPVRDLDYLSLVVAAEAREGTTDYREHFDFVKDNLTFVDEEAINAARDRNARWDFYSFSTNEYEYDLPLFLEWDLTLDDASDWPFSLQPEAGSDTFFKTGVFNLSANIEGAGGALSNVLIGYALQDVDQLTLTNAHTLYGQFMTWDAVSYTAHRDGERLSGRVYSAAMPGGKTFAVWFELPMIRTENGYAEDIETVRAVFEPIVDGYQVWMTEQIAVALTSPD